ncbi:hypothetical protein CALCODRAFT_552912 [Calocera cornea HHB12733]|uniref:Uncharacterized protein n=1 Tax=Calocera cornea HHB12733 TaxID=1353952 RepID=A0A165JHM3_9BASI|nr:hypothetical protein CALCODRAFT_552912 [Calocera cornea HHB12733]
MRRRGFETRCGGAAPSWAGRSDKRRGAERAQAHQSYGAGRGLLTKERSTRKRNLSRAAAGPIGGFTMTIGLFWKAPGGTVIEFRLTRSFVISMPHNMTKHAPGDDGSEPAKRRKLKGTERRRCRGRVGCGE